MSLEIVVTEKWAHPEFLGTRTEQKRFLMSAGEQAEAYFNKRADVCSKSGGMAHVFIEIVEKIN